MEGKLQTSFIPKQPLVETKIKKTQVSRSIFSIIGAFVFAVVLVASIGVFAYEQYLTKTIDSKNIELSNRVKNFDKSSVSHFVKLDARFQAAAIILNNHLAVSTLFGLISDNTIKSVQFTDFKYTMDDSGKLNVSLSGKAPNFASVALQSDTFSAKPYLQNQVFSGLGLASDGGVLFKYTALVDPSAIKYKVATTTN